MPFPTYRHGFLSHTCLRVEYLGFLLMLMVSVATVASSSMQSFKRRERLDLPEDSCYKFDHNLLPSLDALSSSDIKQIEGIINRSFFVFPRREELILAALQVYILCC